MEKPQSIRLQQQAMITARMMGTPENLLQRLVTVESDWNQWATRYEPAFKRYWRAPRIVINTTEETELVHQRTSWGLCQIMGFTARRLGWEAPIPALLEPESNLQYACIYLNQLHEHPAGGGSWRWAITAYNHGEEWEEREPKWFREGYTSKFHDILSAMGEA